MAWMVTQDRLDPEQRDFVNNEINKDKNFWIKGWAGSGKTVLLVHAIKQKLEENPNLNICIVSYTWSLIDMVKTGIHELGIPDIPIMTYHKFMRQPYQTYDYIFCDEVQDLPANVLETMRERSRYVIVAGDSNQSIYDGTVTPSEIGRILNAQPFELSFIHRLTRSIINAVSSLLPSLNIFSAKRDMTKQDVDIRLIKAYDQEEEVKYVWEQASNATSVGDATAVLLPTHDSIKRFIDLLCRINDKSVWESSTNQYDKPEYSSLNLHFRQMKIKAEYVGNNYGSFEHAQQNRNLIIMTYHSSKGMDFDNVFLPFLSTSTYIPSSDPHTLFMVAMTRSRKNLFITYSEYLHHFIEKFESSCIKINAGRQSTDYDSGDFDF